MSQLVDLAAKVDDEASVAADLTRQLVDIQQEAVVNGASVFLGGLAVNIEVVAQMIKRYKDAQEARGHAAALKVRARYLSYGEEGMSADQLRRALLDASDSLESLGDVDPIAVVEAVNPPLETVSREAAERYLRHVADATEHVRLLLTPAEPDGTASLTELRGRAYLLDSFWDECLGGLYTRINDGIEQIKASAAAGKRHD